MTRPISVVDDGAVRTLTIERPNRRNAIDDATIFALLDELAAAEADHDVRTLVLTGSGGLAFCAGSDLKAAQAMTVDERVQHAADGQRLMERIETHRCLTIAAVEGWALGGGFELVLACDLVVAAETAQFGLPEVQKGMLPAWGGTYRLTRALGLSRARNAMLGGQILDAQQAGECGLAIERVAGGQAVTAAVQLGKRISETSTSAQLQLGKRLLLAGADAPSSTGSLAELLAESLQARNDGYGRGQETVRS